MIIAGIGCGRETSAEDIVSLISMALANFGIAPENLTAIATETSKADQHGIAGAARSLSLPIVRCPVADLGRVAGRLLPGHLRGVIEPSSLRADPRRLIGAALDQRQKLA